MAYLGVTWIIRIWLPDAFPPLHERPLLIYAVAALLLGAQMMSIGLLAELLTAYSGRDEESYSIAEQTPARTVDASAWADVNKPEAEVKAQ
jgi:hypothetical protein